MFARWPALPIQLSQAAAAELWPAAMFSPM
jgi:hypothetical protein